MTAKDAGRRKRVQDAENSEIELSANAREILSVGNMSDVMVASAMP